MRAETHGGLAHTLYQSAFWHTILYRAVLRCTCLQSYTRERGLVLYTPRGSHGYCLRRPLYLRPPAARGSRCDLEGV